MKPKNLLQLKVPLWMVALVLAALAVIAIRFWSPVSIRPLTVFSGWQNGSSGTTGFDYEQAAEISALRWQAMARYYEDQDLLTRDHFDYERAADHMAFRWHAMAQAYQDHGLLNYADNPDNVMAFRWNAMATAYQNRGLLNYAGNPDDVMAFRWLAMARAYEQAGLLNTK